MQILINSVSDDILKLISFERSPLLAWDKMKQHYESQSHARLLTELAHFSIDPDNIVQDLLKLQDIERKIVSVYGGWIISRYVI